jgi:hypothetical protein
MPNMNGTGPTGKGPLTGRGSGECIVPLNTRDEELTYLKNQEKVLRNQLQQVQTRIGVLEAASAAR